MKNLQYGHKCITKIVLRSKNFNFSYERVKNIRKVKKFKKGHNYVPKCFFEDQKNLIPVVRVKTANLT